MPIKKKHTTRNQIIVWTIVVVVLALMIISFAPTQHMTEIVLYP